MRHCVSFVFLFFLIISSSSFAMTCVDNNFDKCESLGYTESSCQYGGISCPFDVSKWHCAKWTCEDGRYSAVKDPAIGQICSAVSYKDLSCFECMCSAPAACKWTDANKGTANISNQCCNGNYETCTSTCAAAVTVPANATATATCTGCGTTVNTAWACNNGYTQSGSSCMAVCMASNSSELISRAASGICSTVIMTNNITLATDAQLNVARSTTIDGQNYTLFINGTMANYTPIVLNGGDLRKLKISHSQTTNKSGVSTISNNAPGAIIQDVTITISSRLTSGWSMVFINSGSIKIYGNLTITSNGGYAFGGFGGGGIYTFTNSTTLITVSGTEGYIFDKGTFNLEEQATVTGKTTGYKGLATAGSVININPGSSLSLSTDGSAAYGLWSTSVNITAGSFSLLTTNSMMGYPKGTVTSESGMLTFNGHSAGTVDIVTLDRGGWVDYKGTRYKPIRAATTSLSDLPRSTNFIVW